MSDSKFDVIFSGEIQTGFKTGDVKNNFARLFKIPAEKVEQLFSTPRVVLKAEVDRPTADKYKAALAKAGAVITIEARQDKNTPPPAVSEVPVAVTDPPPAPAIQPMKNAGPVWGRKFEGNASGTTLKETPDSGGRNAEYGSLERGITGNFQFTIGDALSEAWQKVSGNKLTTFLACMLYLGIVIALSIGTSLMTALMAAVAGEAGSMAGSLLAQILFIVAATPLNAGLIMLGVRMSVNAPVSPGLILRYYNRIWPLTITMALMYAMVLLGFLLLIIPGIYLSIAYMLALPLVVDKGLSPWRALEASRKAITHRWFTVFGLCFLLGLLYLIGILPLLAGLIWIAPLGLIALGILYRNIFGVSSVAAGF